MHKLAITAISSLSLGLVACGGDKIDQVREDFQNPTGSTSNKDAVIAVEAQSTGASPVMGLVSGGVPGALTAYGKQRGLEQVSVRHWESRAEELFQAWADARAGRDVVEQRAQLVGQGCANSAEANAAFEEIWREFVLDAAFGFGSASGDAEYSVDVNACSEGELEGSLSIYLKIEASDDEVFFEVKHTMDVCETSGAMACVRGETIMRASGTDDGGEASTAEVLSYWDVEGTWEDDGVTRTAALRGGVRIGGMSSASGDTATIEYLFYVQTPDGEEYSYVWTFTATNVGGMGEVSWTLRGADGEITCTATDTMVSCSGSADFSYTEAEAEAIESSWFGG